MTNDRLKFYFLNVGHFLDHLFMLIFATVAALRLTEEWGMSYAELIPYATPGFIAFGICALPAGWLCGQVEPRRHDGHLLHRHRRKLDRHRDCGYADSDRARIARHRRLCRDLPPGRTCVGRARPGEDRGSAGGQRRVRQPGRGGGSADHGLLHRHRGLAQCVRVARHRLHRPWPGGTRPSSGRAGNNASTTAQLQLPPIPPAEAPPL